LDVVLKHSDIGAFSISSFFFVIQLWAKDFRARGQSAEVGFYRAFNRTVLHSAWRSATDV